MDLSTRTRDRIAIEPPPVAVPAQRQTCQPWCVDHTDDLCNAADIPIPGEVPGGGSIDPYVGLMSIPEDGPRIIVYCERDEHLTLDEAEEFAHALLAQVARARSLR
ncbi:hypothetical protein [Nonomuraea sp. NPDC049646]|uniref:hypothetical protein n=1 Tax=unclassified Nonomuraea TaxID=2593643 RepID=UPI0037B9D5F1